MNIVAIINTKEDIVAKRLLMARLNSMIRINEFYFDVNENEESSILRKFNIDRTPAILLINKN